VRVPLYFCYAIWPVLVSCAEQPPPPPPKHPALEGDWPSVSRDEIMQAITMTQKDIAEIYGSPLRAYKVHVTGRNHMEVCFRPPRTIEECHPLERVKGRWKTSERIIITGQNTPSG
jgi:hypothetical protein